jgi:hypothetical protein
MKKISIISILVPVIIVFVMAFSFNIDTEPAQMTTDLNVQVSGCPNNDCSQLFYCLDGGPAVFVGSCNFTIKCSDGQHFICVKCSGSSDIGGGKWFMCPGTSDILYINIPELKNCQCDLKKKK